MISLPVCGPVSAWKGKDRERWVSPPLPVFFLPSVDVPSPLGPQGRAWEEVCGVDVLLSSLGAENGQERRRRDCAGQRALCD